MIPTQFRTHGEPSIASYNYTDIAEATGIVEYKGFKYVSGATLSGHLLTTSSLNSAKPDTSITCGAVSGTFLNADFDVMFNMPRIIDGNMYAVIPLAMTDWTDKSARNCAVDVNVCHYDGTTETSMGRSSGGLYHASTSQTPEADRYTTLLIPLDRTHFKKGEYLRIKVHATYSKAGGDGSVFIGHDPADRAVTFVAGDDLDHTKMSFYTPFWLDI